MQVKKQQLEPDVEQQTGSGWGRNTSRLYIVTLLISLICRVHTSCQMPGWMQHKLESRFLEEAVSPSFSSSDIHMASEQPHPSLLASSYPQGSFPPCAQTASPLHHSNASWGSPVNSTKRLQTSPRSTGSRSPARWCHSLPPCPTSYLTAAPSRPRPPCSPQPAAPGMDLEGYVGWDHPKPRPRGS